MYKAIAWPFSTYHDWHWMMKKIVTINVPTWGVFNCSFFFRFFVNQICVDIKISHVQKQLATQATPAPMYTEWPLFFVFSICIKMFWNLRMLERFQKIFQPKHTLRPSGLRRKFENSVRSIRVPAVEMAWVRLVCLVAEMVGFSVTKQLDLRTCPFFRWRNHIFGCSRYVR